MSPASDRKRLTPDQFRKRLVGPILSFPKSQAQKKTPSVLYRRGQFEQEGKVEP